MLLAETSWSKKSLFCSTALGVVKQFLFETMVISFTIDWYDVMGMSNDSHGKVDRNDNFINEICVKRLLRLHIF